MNCLSPSFRYSLLLSFQRGVLSLFLSLVLSLYLLSNHYCIWRLALRCSQTLKNDSTIDNILEHFLKCQLKMVNAAPSFRRQPKGKCMDFSRRVCRVQKPVITPGWELKQQEYQPARLSWGLNKIMPIKHLAQYLTCKKCAMNDSCYYYYQEAFTIEAIGPKRQRIRRTEIIHAGTLS